MIAWLLALAAGFVAAGIAYAGTNFRDLRVALAAVARAIAIALIVALLLDAAGGATRPATPWVALDASESMRRGDSALWRLATDSATAIGADTVILFGDSVRLWRDPSAVPRDRASRLSAVAERAGAAGQPLIIITDGELDDDPSAVALPPGSRVITVARRTGPDAALVSLAAPRSVVIGDTVRMGVEIAAGAAGAPAGEITVQLDGRAVVALPLPALAPHGQRREEVAFRVTGAEGPAIVRVAIRTAGDAEPRNDTLATAIDRSRGASVVFASTSPDLDSRFALGVLRGALAIPTRAYLQVAPGVWRIEGSLAPASESEVRAAMRDAPVAILHGDTARFGAPRGVTRGALALLVPAGAAATADGEWYPSSAPLSPISPSLGGIGWDSLPPIVVAPAEPVESWRGLEVRRGRSGAPVAVIAGTDGPRRIAVVAASGLWRWQFRGGAGADAHAALWGSLFDWLAEDAPDRRAAIADPPAVRAGSAVRWRRGAATDSTVTVTLRRGNDGGRVDSMTLRFGRSATVETPPLDEGVYTVVAPGGSSLLVVNPSREWVPRRPTASAVTGTRRGPPGAAPRLRDAGWSYVAVVVLLCGEWILRRRAGLR